MGLFEGDGPGLRWLILNRDPLEGAHFKRRPRYNVGPLPPCVRARSIPLSGPRASRSGFCIWPQLNHVELDAAGRKRPGYQTSEACVISLTQNSLNCLTPKSS